MTHSIPARGWTTDLPRSWAAFAAASYSHSLIQDNVIYAYGSSLVFDPTTQSYISNCPGVPGAPVYFFCPAVSGVTDGGDYGVYDYRDPGELRIDAESEGMLIGHLKKWCYQTRFGRWEASSFYVVFNSRDFLRLQIHIRLMA